MQIPLLQYWDGQPVVYVCRKRPETGKSPVGKEGMFFSVGIEIVDEDVISDLESRGGEVLDLHELGCAQGSAEAPPNEENAGEMESTDSKDSGEDLDVSDDVD